MNGDRASIVYLDQFVWVRLLQGLAESDGLAVEVRDALVHLRTLGRIRVPLSGTHYLETWHRKDYRSLRELAELMREVSDYSSIAAVHVSQRFGIACALAALEGAPAPLAPTVVGRGVNHAFGSKTGRFRFVESLGTDGRVEGAELDVGDVFATRRQRDAFVALATSGSSEWEWINLAGDEQMFARFADGLDRSPEHRHGSEAAADEIRLRRWLQSEPRAAQRLEDLIIGQEMDRMAEEVYEVAALRRFDVAHWLGRAGRQGVRDFVAAVPTSDVLARLRHHLHRNPQHPIEQHDRSDLHMLANVVPHCDVVVTERRWAHAVIASGLARRYGTTMVSTLAGLLAELQRAS